MNPVVSSTEEALCAAYQRQAACYVQAIDVAENLLAAWKPGIDPAAALEQIKAIMEQVATINTSIATPRQQWQQKGGQATPALSAAFKSITGLIERLAQRIRELELLASACQSQLVPELDNLLRGRQMQRAYAAAVPRKRHP
jgi:hypothetical protein